MSMQASQENYGSPARIPSMTPPKDSPKAGYSELLFTDNNLNLYKLLSGENSTQQGACGYPHTCNSPPRPLQKKNLVHLSRAPPLALAQVASLLVWWHFTSQKPVCDPWGDTSRFPLLPTHRATFIHLYEIYFIEYSPTLTPARLNYKGVNYHSCDVISRA